MEAVLAEIDADQRYRVRDGLQKDKSPLSVVHGVGIGLAILLIPFNTFLNGMSVCEGWHIRRARRAVPPTRNQS